MTYKAKRQRDAKLEKLAEELVKNPKATQTVACIFYDNAKGGAKRLSRESTDMIDKIKEEDETCIPLDVLKFLKKKKNIGLFFEFVRDKIIDRMVTDKMTDCEIRMFAIFFNSKILKKYKEKCYSLNVRKLVIEIILQEEQVYFLTDPNVYEKKFDTLNMIIENMIKDSSMAYDILLLAKLFDNAH